jgi:hypothetical protein
MKLYKFGNDRAAAYGFAWNMVHSGYHAQVIASGGNFEVKTNG